MVPVVPARGACPSFRAGHSMHPTQARHLWRGAKARRRVDHVIVQDSGLVMLRVADGDVAHRWHHDPASLRTILAERGGRHAVLADPGLLVVGALGISTCTLDRLTPCPTGTDVGR